MGFQPNAPPQEKKANWEIAYGKFVAQLTQQNAQLSQQTTAFMEETRVNFKNHDASIWNLELQSGQLSKQISNLKRSQGTLPSDIIPKLREYCNAITLKSGRIVQQVEKDVSREGERKRIE